MPALVPSIGGAALVEVRDYDKGFKDETVGTIAVSFDEALRALDGSQQQRQRRGGSGGGGVSSSLRWYHLYAPGRRRAR